MVSPLFFLAVAQFRGDVQKPPKLDLRIVAARMKTSSELEVTFCVQNVGGGVSKIDPGMIMGTLVNIRISDEFGKTVRYRGDDGEGAAPLDPEHPLRLVSGFFYGASRTLRLSRTSKRLFVQAFLGYSNPLERGDVWTGSIHSLRTEVVAWKEN